MSESLILAAARELATAMEQVDIAHAAHIDAKRREDAAGKKAEEARLRAKEAERRLVELSRKPVVAKPAVVAPPEPAPVVPQPSPVPNAAPLKAVGTITTSHIPNLARRRA